MHYLLKTTKIMDVASLRPNISSENLPEETVSCGQSYTCQNTDGTRIGENWGELRYGERCLGFHTREYSARLLDAPVLANWKAICESTPIEIHGHLYEKPERCERQVIVDWINRDHRLKCPKLFVGAVVGYWLVKSEETNCGTSWNRFSDEVNHFVPETLFFKHRDRDACERDQDIAYAEVFKTEDVLLTRTCS
jgi:hypothetical protein